MLFAGCGFLLLNTERVSSLDLLMQPAATWCSGYILIFCITNLQIIVEVSTTQQAEQNSSI